MRPLPSPAVRPAPRRLQRWGIVLWPGFVMAGLACTVLFALIDPATAVPAGFPAVSRQLGYSVGFLVAWAATAGSSALTLLLMQRTAAPAGDDEVPLG